MDLQYILGPKNDNVVGYMLRKALERYLFFPTIMAEQKWERGRVGRSNGRAQSSAKTMDRTLVFKDDDIFLYTQVHYILLIVLSKGSSDQLMVAGGWCRTDVKESL